MSTTQIFFDQTISNKERQMTLLQIQYELLQKGFPTKTALVEINGIDINLRTVNITNSDDKELSLSDHIKNGNGIQGIFCNAVFDICNKIQQIPSGVNFTTDDKSTIIFTTEVSPL